MFRNHLRTAWRNINRNRGYSALNIVGLAIGMAVALLIGLWSYHEYSYDRFLPGYGQLFQVRRNFREHDQVSTYTSSSLKLADALRNQVPEFAHIAETDLMGPHGLMAGDKRLFMNGAMVGGDFLRMFRFPLLKGSAGTVFSDAYSIVLTQSTAIALFGKGEVLGRTVRIDNRHDVKVTGIMKDLPDNSTFRFHFLLPFSFLEQTESYVRDQRASGFDENSYYIFAQLKPGISLAQVAPKIISIQKTEKTYNAQHSEVILQPMSRWHLYGNYQNGKDSGGLIEYVWMFGIIGVMVLLIACINFINLTTARSEKRTKEVGIRKTIGSGRRSLVLQFLVESFLLTTMAFLLSLLLVQLALPGFNALTGGHVGIPFFNWAFWAVMGAFVTGTSLLAGSRPAFYLSSFQPIRVLKGALKAGNASTFSRKFLVVLQFTCSIALIIGTGIIYRQIEYARQRPTGYNIDRVLSTRFSNDLGIHFDALRDELVQSGIAESVTEASSPATDVWWHSGFSDWPGRQAGETSGDIGKIVVTGDYFKTLGMTLLSGRDFRGAEDSTAIILNEATIKRLHLKEPLNQVVIHNNKPLRIIGVVKDALMESPYAPADPTMFVYDPDPTQLNVVMYRLSPGIKTEDALSRLGVIFNKYNPAYPYEYQFMDQAYADKFSFEVLVGRLAGIFAALAIFISCLGLFGLAAYVAEQRTKEIGIRKVLGASIPQLWLMLSKDFILLVLISCVIASPLAYHFLRDWLDRYDYHIGIDPLVFVGATGGAIFITLLTVSFQAIKAAAANPVKSLRTE